MRNRIIQVMLATIIAGINVGYAVAPANLTCAKQQVIKYYQTHKFEEDVGVVVDEARAYLLRRVAENKHAAHPKPLAIVLDIDETVLSNFNSNLKNDFSELPEYIDRMFKEANAPAIEPMLNFYNEALKNDVKVFFVTFRPESVHEHTILNLNRAGYYRWSELYFPNDAESKAAPSIYKTAIRRMLTEQGYDIVLNMGDQISDLEGGYSEQVYKIPNPLYANTVKVCQG